MLKFILILSFSLFAFSLVAQKSIRHLSSENWYLSFDGSSESYPAIVPGYVHLDLLKNNLIPDPFYGTNETAVQWIDSSNFTYSIVFQLTEEEFAKPKATLVFEGIDGYAEIILNEKTIASPNNMFREWEINIKDKLKIGDNNLRVIFTPSLLKNKLLAEANQQQLPGDERIYARKAQYMFGWDWGATLVSAGIWKDVKLVFGDYAELQQVAILQKTLTADLAELEITTQLKIDKQANYKLKYSLFAPDSTCIKSETTKLKNDCAKLEWSIKNPMLWWTHDLGKANLYRLSISLFEEKTKLETKEYSIGFRNIQLVQQPDSIGQSFYFELNGIPLFAKGANVIPFNHFPTAVKPSDYQFYLDKVVEANMNMLRVWGGGIYESDEFYKLCDEKGILVWQDFMFAGAMYPSDSLFINNVEEEVKQQVIRLRHHASLALWCGNNEISEAWHNWGWQKQMGYSAQDSTKIIQDYQDLFEQRIPKILKELDPQRSYHPSSPANGWGRRESYLQADVHYWGVWWGMEPLESYQQKTGRFVSEFGFQGIPSESSLLNFIPETALCIDSPAMQSHQKHPRGYQTINIYLDRDFPKASNFSRYVYLSQLLQARAIKMGIESQRGTYPICMGSLVWQLNDTWPVVSWSLIDAYKQPKAAYFQAKRSFAPILPIISENDQAYELSIVSDLLSDSKAEIVFSVYDFTAKLLAQKKDSIQIPAQSAKHYLSILKSDFSIDYNSTANLLIHAEVRYSDGLIAEQFYYPMKPKEMLLIEPQIEIKILANQWLEIVTKNFLAKDVYLDAVGIYFDDNFFDLLPNKPKRVHYSGEKAKPLSTDQIKISSLWEK